MIRPSKIDIWIALLLIAGPLILVNLGIYLHKTGEEQNSLICISAGMLIGVVTWILAFPCQYTLEDKSLLAQAGILKWRIPYAEIQTVELSNSILSGPALSLQRIEVQYDRGRILISPNERDLFLNELRKKVSMAKS